MNKRVRGHVFGLLWWCESASPSGVRGFMLPSAFIVCVVSWTLTSASPLQYRSSVCQRHCWISSQGPGGRTGAFAVQPVLAARLQWHSERPQLQSQDLCCSVRGQSKVTKLHVLEFRSSLLEKSLSLKTAFYRWFKVPFCPACCGLQMFIKQN